MSEWIKCSKRLPDIEADTLLVVVETDVPVDGDTIFSDTDGFEDGRFVFWGKYSSAKVTHWMYLPEPPK